jgi:hypothetical protein
MEGMVTASCRDWAVRDGESAGPAALTTEERRIGSGVRRTNAMSLKGLNIQYEGRSSVGAVTGVVSLDGR